MNVIKELSESDKELVVLHRTGMTTKEIRQKLQDGRELAQSIVAIKDEVGLEAKKTAAVSDSLKLSEEGKVALEKKIAELQGKNKKLSEENVEMKNLQEAMSKKIAMLESKVEVLKSDKQQEFGDEA